MNVTNNFSGQLKPLIYNAYNISDEENQKKIDKTVNRISTVFERKLHQKRESVKKQKEIDDSYISKSRDNSEVRGRSRPRSIKFEEDTPAPEPEEKEPAYLSTGWINQKIARLEKLAQKQMMRFDANTENKNSIDKKEEQPENAFMNRTSIRSRKSDTNRSPPRI
jgi:hypothetical protein